MPRLNTPVDIHFVHYRHRLIDPDNLSVKGVIDALVTAELLPNDSAEQISKISHQQIKIPSKRLEKTEVIITEAG